MLQAPTKSSRVEVNQQDNLNANFGLVLRSSGIFYYKKDAHFKTTISFLNYWSLKRDIEVLVLASIRDMQGNLIRRQPLSFDHGMVVNYSPNVSEEPFEGSVEIEVFSLENMVIPYAAIMVTYETSHGITMVHSYTRTYAQHEIEEKRTFMRGEEGCWTVRDDANTYSFGVFHNGGHACPAQKMTLNVLNAQNYIQSVEFDFPALSPYETIIIKPRQYLPELVEHLQGQPGNATLSFQVQDSFSRLLLGNARLDDSDWQVTHSNFNYSVFETDKIQTDNQVGFMDIPGASQVHRELVVYPDCDAGTYQLLFNDEPRETLTFHPGETVQHTFATDHPMFLQFQKNDGNLPSRIVTGLRFSQHPDRIPAECSLGIDHQQIPPKRLWWGLCSLRPDLNAKLYIRAMSPVFGQWNQEPITIRLYSSEHTHYLEKTLKDYHDFESGYSFLDLFPNQEAFLNNHYGWFTLFSEYAGFRVYSSFENASKSFCFEHGF